MNSYEGEGTSDIRYAAIPLSRDDIAYTALQLRKLVDLEDIVCFDIVRFIENVLPELHPNFQFEVVKQDILQGKYAETIPSFQDGPAIMRVREDVYEDAAADGKRSRFTLTHELGHLLLHTPTHMTLCRLETELPIYKDPEWQANTFAGEFLVMRHLARGMSPFDIADKFHVSYSVAEIQAKYCRYRLFHCYSTNSGNSIEGRHAYASLSSKCIA